MIVLHVKNKDLNSSHSFIKYKTQTFEISWRDGEGCFLYTFAYEDCIVYTPVI